MQRDYVVATIEAYTYGYIGKALGWDKSKCDSLIEAAVKEVKDDESHLFVQYSFVWGQRLKTV